MKLVNAMGKPCPMPVILAKQALDGGESALTVLVDNPIAVENLTRLAASRGLTASASETGGGFSVVIAGEGSAPAPAPVPSLLPTCSSTGCGTAVLISRETFGQGNDALGRTLMKMFLYTLSQEEVPPAALLFLNGGVLLPSLGEEQVIESLTALQDKGCEILVCGTCLNYFGLTEQLRIGTVSNMYDIVQKLQSAAKLITP